MTVNEWLEAFQQLGRTLNSPGVKDTSGLLLIGAAFILTVLQVSKVKVNPWSWIIDRLGRALNKELLDEVADIKKDLLMQKEDFEKDQVLQARRRILSAADEIRRGIPHSDEFFTEVLGDVDTYTTYCKDHPKFENSKAENSIELIKSTHFTVVKENKFV